MPLQWQGSVQSTAQSVSVCMHVCLCVCARVCDARARVYACFVSVTECVCDHFPEATAARRIPECRELLCDDYQVAHVFPTSFPPSFLLSVLYSPLSLMFAFSPLICDCMWVVFTRASVVLFPSQLPVLILPYEIYTISLLFFFISRGTHTHTVNAESQMLSAFLFQNQMHL